MLRPDILECDTIQEAFRALSRRGAVPLAGATDLIPAMHKGEIRPRLLVNLKRIPGLAEVRRVRQGLRIGALTRIADIPKSPLVARDYPILVEVAQDFGAPQIRSLATIGGNLCNAAPSADFALPLLVLDARVEINGGQGVRELELRDFFRGVNKTALRRGELLTAIFLPRPRVRTGAARAKLGIRQSMDLAFVGVAAALQLAPDRRTCRAARVALGSVAPVPMRAEQVEALLTGMEITPALIERAAAAAAAESRPVSDLRASAQYRRQMTKVLTQRVLHEAFRRAQKEKAR